MVDYELATCRNNLIFPADFNNNVVLESEEEELEENTLYLLHLRRISYDRSLYRRNYLLAASAFQSKCKSVFLETTIPPLTTRTAGEVPNQQMMFCAKAVAKGGANASVTLYLGSGASFCQLKTTINNPDS